MLTQELLERIKTIQETGSFAKAADKLYLSRQALLSQITSLEQEIGFAIFQRSAKGTVFTKAGLLFFRESIGIMDSYQGLLRKCNETAAGIHSLRIGSLPNLPGISLPKICREYQKIYPNVTLHFLDFPLKYYFDLFNIHTFDIMSENMMNYHHHLENLDFLLLRKMPQHIGVSENSPLAKKKKISFKDLRGLTLLMYRKGIGKSEDQLREYLHKNEPDINIVDIDLYDSSLVARTFMSNCVVLLYTTKSYPGLASIPADWDMTIDLGIGYHKQHGEDVANLLSLTEELNRKIDIFS
ncbi:MAG: LysR family transcriptional regulator [Acidaminococcaceae bacterium]|nr:LysR family transcriptional regulator [Acidaminococcaceae bacterium]